MKKIFTTTLMAMALTMSTFAVTVNEVAGTFIGNLNIGGQNYPNKEVFVLPGVVDNTITFVLPDFKYGNGDLGNIVLPNIPMGANGQLTLEDATLYLKAISERAKITVLNDFHDGSDVYNSVLSASSAMILLSIEAPASLPEPIFVLFTGNKSTNNYAIVNGGFEGSWSNNEAPKWHSFPSATGSLASMISSNTQQFQQSSETRPGSAGSNSVLLQSNMTVGVKANGNCTNGQINAGSMTADDASGNYNFSDPSNSGYNTPFVGNPDSMVFWAKYIPADNNPSNSENRARAHAVITTNARYQDPEVSDYSSVKVADAAINYAATTDMGWQRLSVPFNYTSVDPATAAYVLVTFTTNQTPGGGSTYSTGSLFNPTVYPDNIYLDDAEMIYNYDLTSLKMDGAEINFTNGAAETENHYSDSTFTFDVTTNGKGAKTFVAYYGAENQVLVYVVPNNYAQKQDYSVYTVQMLPEEPKVTPTETYYRYTATVCDNELPYTDEFFKSLKKANTYTKTLKVKNMYGLDSIVVLTLNVLPTYELSSDLTITEGTELTWEGYDLSTYPVGEEQLKAQLTTMVGGCDSTLILNLTVEAKVTTALPTNNTRKYAKKVIDNGHLYIIRDDETLFDVLGRKIK